LVNLSIKTLNAQNPFSPLVLMIVGMPNVGKSTILNFLKKKSGKGAKYFQEMLQKLELIRELQDMFPLLKLVISH